ncbi:zona occludens toxin [Acidovorax sp. 69]|uniref:zonular occludens toxin domain-containing protein n=1 Tax=Acidovorax sp. 69 TaxID=2035202 RepID=UPI000C23473F|nr:zonular occludens toxin domain-containing protein [Acidovorax sp. 69]PJI97928.1 zona occludens toxin [Acidovorax sp. 69]
MPINIVTGLPRQGKTLFTFIQVMERAKKENRPVFYCNIPEVTLDGWTRIDHPDKWMDCPNDSIIVVDELQQFWGMASTGARVPLPILELSMHGKRGIDFYFITQDPTLIHATPRKLCETHWHVVRAFGSENAVAHKFNRMQTDPEKVKAKSEKYPWRYPKEAFGKKDKAGNWITKPWYKSADVHNIKRSIPTKLWAIPVGLLLAGLAIYAAFYFASGAIGKASGSGSAIAAKVDGARPPVATGSGAAASVGPMTAAQYLASRTPRFPDFPQTAPAYDDVTKPTEAPYPAACVQMGKTCKCYTQQATLLQVSAAACLQIVQHGFFMDWKRAQVSPETMREKALPRPYAEGSAPLPVRAQPSAMPAPAPSSEPSQNTYLQGLAARNAQVRSSLQ